MVSDICTIMIGRTDDWVKAYNKREGITVHPAAPDWAGVAVFKRAAAIFAERGYRARLLAAAYRHHLHWSELIGGDVSMTIPFGWQKLFNASSIEVKDRWADPVPQTYVDELLAKCPEFVKAYEPDGLAIEDFEHHMSHCRSCFSRAGGRRRSPRSSGRWISSPAPPRASSACRSSASSARRASAPSSPAPSLTETLKWGKRSRSNPRA